MVIMVLCSLMVMCPILLRRRGGVTESHKQGWGQLWIELELMLKTYELELNWNWKIKYQNELELMPMNWYELMK